MGKGGHGNPHLFPVNQILNLKIKYPVPRRKNQDYFFPSRRILISQSVLSNKLTQTEIIPPLTRQVCVEKKKKIYGLVGLVHIAYRSHSNWREKLCANCAGGSHLPDNFKEWGYFTTYFNPPTSI